MQRIRTFIKKLDLDRDGIVAVVVVFCFFIFSQSLSFQGNSAFNFIVCIILGVALCLFYSLLVNHTLKLFDEKNKIFAFAFLACDFCLYGYFFNTPDIMRCVSLLLFCVSLICIFQGKNLFIPVLFAFFSCFYIPSLTVITIILLLCDCFIKNRGSIFAFFSSVVLCLFRLVLYYAKVNSFSELRYKLFSTEYLFLDAENLIHILSVLPVLIFFTAFWIKSIQLTRNSVQRIAYVIPIIFSFLFAALAPFVQNYLGPFFINTVCLCFFVYRKNINVSKAFSSVTTYVTEHPLIIILLLVSYSAFKLQDYYNFNNLFDGFYIIE